MLSGISFQKEPWTKANKLWSSVHAIKKRWSVLVQRRVRANLPTSLLRGDVNKRLHRDAPRWQGCQHPEIRVTTLTEAWTRMVARVTRAFLISESGASPPRVSDNAAPVYSCSHWRVGGLRHKSIRAWAARPRTVKETVPHGRDVIQPQLTGITQRPSDGDAWLFASYCTFCSAERARVRELMG